jgi:hypothetical protein
VLLLDCVAAHAGIVGSVNLVECEHHQWILVAGVAEEVGPDGDVNEGVEIVQRDDDEHCRRVRIKWRQDAESLLPSCVLHKKVDLPAFELDRPALVVRSDKRLVVAPDSPHHHRRLPDAGAPEKHRFAVGAPNHHTAFLRRTATRYSR